MSTANFPLPQLRLVDACDPPFCIRVLQRKMGGGNVAFMVPHFLRIPFLGLENQEEAMVTFVFLSSNS